MRAFARNLAIAIWCCGGLARMNVAAGGEYVWSLPPGFPPPAVPADNPMSEAKVALGCRLFFEPRLSVTREHSCASCHHPELAFTDGRALAVGATGEKLTRGAMTLANVAYSPAFTWANDRLVTLEAQMEQPLFSEHPIEMGLERDDAALLEWLAQDAGYATAFRDSFPDEAAPIAMGNVIKAIAAFERTLVSGRSAFDRYVYDDDRAALSVTAKRGMSLFFSKRSGCAQCHSGLNFSGPIVYRGASPRTAIFANNGTYDETARDDGLMAVTAREQDRGRFKVPSLRNIELTAPYMHDGRFATLDAVIEHYAAGGQRSEGARSAHVDPLIRPLDLTADEKQALLEFLRSLTDRAFVSDGAFACARRTSEAASH